LDQKTGYDQECNSNLAKPADHSDIMIKTQFTNVPKAYQSIKERGRGGGIKPHRLNMLTILSSITHPQRHPKPEMRATRILNSLLFDRRYYLFNSNERKCFFNLDI